MKMQTKSNQNFCPEEAFRYGRVLYELQLPAEAVQKAREIFETVPELGQVFANPVVSIREKTNVIDRVFPKEIRSFLKVACKYQRMHLIEDIFNAYDRICDEQDQILNAVLTCTVPPTKEQENGIESFLCRKYGVKEARLEICRDEELLGGFILRAGSDEYDWSVKGRLERLKLKLT